MREKGKKLPVDEVIFSGNRVKRDLVLMERQKKSVLAYDDAMTLRFQ